MTRHFRLVAALDGTSASRSVLEHTLDQAARHETPEIHLLVVANGEDDVPRLEAWLARVADTLRRSAWRDDEWHTHLHVREGVFDEEVASLAGEIDADLIVIARRRLDNAICPTLVVGQAEAKAASCAVCAGVREESQGACWYCARHERDSRTLLTMRLESPAVA